MPSSSQAPARPRRRAAPEPHELDRLLGFSLAAIAFLIVLVLILKQL